MASNTKYDGASVTLPVKDTNYDTVVYLPSKPVLDSELNLMTDLNSAKVQEMIRSKIPSGWLSASFSRGFDSNSDSFGINTALVANTLTISSNKSTPMVANVNGWILNVGGTGIASDNKIKIVLEDSPSAVSREDLVFLEVWKCEVSANLDTNKPDINKIYKFGNTQYSGSNLSDDIINPNINYVTSKRVQIQYRVRVVSGVDFFSHPEGVSDLNTVHAQGSKISPNSEYSFINAGTSLDDYGLYISGSGSQEDMDALGTVDGFVYAIPMFRIHRRNKGSFSISNQNGSSVSILSGNASDRPDGLFYDQIDTQDIEDLRHSVSFGGFDHQALLDKTLDEIFSGDYSAVLTKSRLDGSLESSGKLIYIDRIASTTEANTSLVTKPNSQQRYYSDVSSTVVCNTSKKITDKSLGLIGTSWANADQITVSVASVVGRASASISTNTPIVKFIETSGSSISDVSGVWTGLGTSQAIFTFGSNPTLSTQEVFISYELDYLQKGDKLSKPVSEMLKVRDLRNNEDWGFVSATDFDDSATSFENKRRKKRSITKREAAPGVSDHAYVYRINSSYNLNGIGTLYSYFVNSSGAALSFLIPASLINNLDASYVYGVYSVSQSNYVSIETTQKNIDGSITVTLSLAVPGLLRFDIALKGGVLEFDERTQSILDLARVDFYSIKGNGTNNIILKGSDLEVDPTEEIIGFQTEIKEVAPSVFSTSAACYVNGIRRHIGATISPRTSLISLSFASNIPSSSVIEIALFTKKTLSLADELNIYYKYNEYRGISSKTNFGNGSNSFIKSKVAYHKNRLQVITSGTGALNTSEYLSSKYQPLIPKLPTLDSLDLGDFTGTIHKSKEIFGGSFTLRTNYGSPYSSGKDNYFTKQGITQKNGTNTGGRFVSSAEESDGSVHKIILGSLVEKVVQDGTGNFIPGELAIKLETNYIVNDTKNRITNSDSGEQNNSFDLFKIEGRPLVK